MSKSNISMLLIWALILVLIYIAVVPSTPTVIYPNDSIDSMVLYHRQRDSLKHIVEEVELERDSIKTKVVKRLNTFDSLLTDFDSLPQETKIKIRYEALEFIKSYSDSN